VFDLFTLLLISAAISILDELQHPVRTGPTPVFRNCRKFANTIHPLLCLCAIKSNKYQSINSESFIMGGVTCLVLCILLYFVFLCFLFLVVAPQLPMRTLCDLGVGGSHIPFLHTFLLIF